MNKLFKSEKIAKNFKNSTDYGDIYLMMRVLYKCYEYSKENSLYLIPIKESSN